ncbi:MAG TPA: hypothetical protein VJT73_14110 [Polyangiaceae bacterium]|nr:hypothetical protein [Polyangiaceae bacterium]
MLIAIPLARFALAALVFVCLSREGDAAAELAAPEVARTRSFLAEGRELRARNDLEGALVRFRAAYEMAPTPTTGTELAQMQLVVGNRAAAGRTLHRVLAMPADAPDPFASKGRGDARALAKKLDEEMTRTVATVEAPKEAPAAPKDPAPPAPRSLPPTFYWGLGVGAAGVVVGGVTGFLALTAKRSREVACKNQCPPQTGENPDPSGRALAGISVASMLVGAAGAGLAVGSLLLQKKKTETKPASAGRELTRSLRVNPALGGVGVSGKF